MELVVVLQGSRVTCGNKSEQDTRLQENRDLLCEQDQDLSLVLLIEDAPLGVMCHA
jgi:hypothetical protein